MIKKKILILSCALLLLFSGWTFGSEVPYLEVEIKYHKENSSTILTLDTDLYLAVNVSDQLSYDKDNLTLTNVGTSSKYGYSNDLVYDGNTKTITFPVYGTPYFILGSTNYEIDSIEIIQNHGVQLYKRWIGDMTTYVGIGIMLILFMMLFRR